MTDYEISTKARNKRTGRRVAIGTAAVVAFLTVGPFNWPTIQSHELGVVRIFGIVQKEPLKPGLRYRPPFAHVEKVTMEYSDLNLFYTTTDDPSGDYTSISAVTKDGFQVEVPVSVNWAINPAMLTAVKARLPGKYTEREITIVRAAVRDAVKDFGYKDGTIYDRDALRIAIEQRIKDLTYAYYHAQGFGDKSGEIVFYGLTTIRGMYPPEDVANANIKLAAAAIEAQALAARTKVPDDRTIENYTKMIQAQAVAKAAENGTANVIVSTGEQPAATIVNTGKGKD